jgi:hypothetical protein
LIPFSIISTVFPFLSACLISSSFSLSILSNSFSLSFSRLFLGFLLPNPTIVGPEPKGLSDGSMISFNFDSISIHIVRKYDSKTDIRKSSCLVSVSIHF